MSSLVEQVPSILAAGLTGRVTRVVGLTTAVGGFPAPLGALCRVARRDGSQLDAEVVGFQGEETVILSYGDLIGVRRGDHVTLVQSVPGTRVGERLLGRVVDGRGHFCDGKPAAVLPHRVSLRANATPAMDRPRIDTPLGTGIRAIDGLFTCGRGQRLGIFSGSGVGKSVLLGQIARSSQADVNVIVKVGERGRETREFIERDLGPDGLARSVVVVATSDQPALLRLRAANLGTAIAEYFRDLGRDVLLLMDSVTRYALAQREIGLAAGEPPATRGYPPSVFTTLAQLLERSGRSKVGSITGFYAVLVEADDTNEPISDTVRGILDGHVILSRKLADRAHWPAIDVLSSISRSMSDITTDEHRWAADWLKKLLAAYAQSEDLITIGAYQPGSNRLVDAAIQLREQTEKFLQQEVSEHVGISDVINDVVRLARMAENLAKQPAPANAGSPQTAGRDRT